MPSELSARGFEDGDGVKVENSEMENSGGVATVNVEGVERVITRAIIGRIVPRVISARGFENGDGVKVENGEVENSGGVATINVERIKRIITRTIIS